MTSRLLTIGAALFWGVSMTWLVRHDVLPAWTADDAPVFDGGDWLAADMLRAQARIEDKHQRRIGTVWTEYTRSENRLTRHDVIWIEGFANVPRLRLEIDANFSPKGTLDEFHLELFGAGERVELVGEDFSGHLAFELRVGPTSRQTFKVDAAVRGMIGDVFRPFPTLPHLAVGQSWRMHMVNPLAVVSGIGPKLIPMLVRVTHRERLPTKDGTFDCFVVETDRARAWVNDRGVVLKQEMDLPVGGTLTIVAEPFDEARRKEVRAVPLP